MKNLVPDGLSKKYAPQKLKKKIFSCSPFVIFLGLNRTLNLPHHNIIFSKDYKKYIQDMADFKDIKEDLTMSLRSLKTPQLWEEEPILARGFPQFMNKEG